MSDIDLETKPAQRPGLGLVAQITAVVGGLLFLALIVGIWFGQGWLRERVDEALARTTAAVDQAQSIAQDVSTAMDSRATEVAAAVADAQQIADDPSSAGDRLTALTLRVSGITDTYADIRSRYVAARDKAANVGTLLGAVDRLLPGVSLPTAPGDILTQVDEKLTTLDDAMTRLASASATSQGVTAAATAVAEQGQVVVDVLAQGSQLAKDLDVRLDVVEVRLAETSDTVASLASTVAIVLTIVLLYIVLLHIALWFLGRRMRAA